MYVMAFTWKFVRRVENPISSSQMTTGPCMYIRTYIGTFGKITETRYTLHTVYDPR
jgi:hypothetical protein